ncbi:sigma factor-like helix-turn-helix DNA-binding protein [Streptomyces sp. H39-S7]|uniref:sigma factor-like helix-turn-helix DNA-binding protein n=1 Tax=Streptomyces sp. H39-S7 TaxID=3004357 RepID=UPI0022AEB28B|nr:sigma factor-like helix-turn-helix DNA-binding protein [Streptomyces sp. H39-S7]MCZ4125476.1 sigma factor-like helix-turn-helix DNA-binding protein [Streptomyces sp. H39-S7]
MDDFGRRIEPYRQELLAHDALLHLGQPGGAAIDRGSLRLAFVAAVQLLSARQRAALILCEVLAFSAAETADILSTSIASVNSSLQRARARLDRAGVLEDHVEEPSQAEQRACVERYMVAFENADIDRLKRLLAEDVLMEMPPMLNWFVGRDNYSQFMGWVFAKAGTRWRLVPVAANGQPGFAAYNLGDHGTFELHTLQLFTVTASGISRNTVFQDAEVFAMFDLAPTIDI